MSTTDIRNAQFILPMAMIDSPLEFGVFHKGYDENNNSLGFCSYREAYIEGKGNVISPQPFYTPSGTHFYFSENITSSFLKDDAEGDLTGTPFIWVDGKEMDKWEDADQTLYIWCITTDKRMPFCFDEFKKVSPLFVGV